MSIILHPGEYAEPLAIAARTEDTLTADYRILHEGCGMILLLNVTAVGTPAGQINTINIQAKFGDTYKTVISLTGLAINSADLYVFRIHPGAATANAWKAVAQDVVPLEGRIQIDHANNSDSITYGLRIQALGV